MRVSRPSEKLGTPRSIGLDGELPGTNDLGAGGAHRWLEHHAVEMYRHLHGPSDRRRRAKGHVAGAQDLLVLDQVPRELGLLVGADPQLGDVGAAGTVRLFLY